METTAQVVHHRVRRGTSSALDGLDLAPAQLSSALDRLDLEVGGDEGEDEALEVLIVGRGTRYQTGS